MSFAKSASSCIPLRGHLAKLLPCRDLVTTFSCPGARLCGPPARNLGLYLPTQPCCRPPALRSGTTRWGRGAEWEKRLLLPVPQKSSLVFSPSLPAPRCFSESSVSLCVLHSPGETVCRVLAPSCLGPETGLCKQGSRWRVLGSLNSQRGSLWASRVDCKPGRGLARGRRFSE